MAKAEYECIFATDEPFRDYGWGYDEDKGLHLRLWEGRLPMNADMIFADLETPSGIQVLFGHNPIGSRSVAWWKRNLSPARCAA